VDVSAQWFLYVFQTGQGLPRFAASV